MVNEKDQTIAALVFRIDPDKYLYPLIQFWPVPSKTSETVLIRKENDSLVLLNDLRYLPHAALKLKMPLTQTERPSVQAALGYKGMWEGKDYRNADVLAYLSSVPGTNWLMVTKIDKSEVNKDLYRETTFIIIGFCFIILAIVAALISLYSHRQRNLYMELWKATEELSTTLHSIGDAVISTDKHGKVLYMNTVAE